MYSNFADNEVIQRGRRKVYQTTDNIELVLPNGKKDGFLKKGEVVYVVKKVRKGDSIIYRFTVIKFADTKRMSRVYSAEKKFFAPYFDKTSSFLGKNDDKKKYIIPAITGLGGGILGYLIAQRYQKNSLAFGFGGLAIGLAVGIFILKTKNGKDK
jgi:hypothetical protein